MAWLRKKTKKSTNLKLAKKATLVQVNYALFSFFLLYNFVIPCLRFWSLFFKGVLSVFFLVIMFLLLNSGMQCLFLFLILCTYLHLRLFNLYFVGFSPFRSNLLYFHLSVSYNQ